MTRQEKLENFKRATSDLVNRIAAHLIKPRWHLSEQRAAEDVKSSLNDMQAEFDYYAAKILEDYIRYSMQKNIDYMRECEENYYNDSRAVYHQDAFKRTARDVQGRLQDLFETKGTVYPLYYEEKGTHDSNLSGVTEAAIQWIAANILYPMHLEDPKRFWRSTSETPAFVEPQNDAEFMRDAPSELSQERPMPNWLRGVIEGGKPS